MRTDKRYNSQDRHYKDPDLMKISYGISMTEIQHKQLIAAAKHFGRPAGEFIASMVNIYLLRVELGERGFRQQNKDFS